MLTASSARRFLSSGDPSASFVFGVSIGGKIVLDPVLGTDALHRRVPQ